MAGGKRQGQDLSPCPQARSPLVLPSTTVRTSFLLPGTWASHASGLSRKAGTAARPGLCSNQGLALKSGSCHQGCPEALLGLGHTHS